MSSSRLTYLTTWPPGFHRTNLWETSHAKSQQLMRKKPGLWSSIVLSHLCFSITKSFLKDDYSWSSHSHVKVSTCYLNIFSYILIQHFVFFHMTQKKYEWGHDQEHIFESSSQICTCPYHLTWLRQSIFSSVSNRNNQSSFVGLKFGATPVKRTFIKHYASSSDSYWW